MVAAKNFGRGRSRRWRYADKDGEDDDRDDDDLESSDRNRKTQRGARFAMIKKILYKGHIPGLKCLPVANRSPCPSRATLTRPLHPSSKMWSSQQLHSILYDLYLGGTITSRQDDPECSEGHEASAPNSFRRIEQ